jgi:hypothetical protein
MANAALAVPEKADERTDTAYRFNHAIPAGRSSTFKVAEEIPLAERIMLANLGLDAMLSYSANGEIPQRVRDGLREAVTLRQNADAAARVLGELSDELERAGTEQSRIRDNLTAAGADTEAGAAYLARLRAIDERIDAVNEKYDTAQAAARDARKAY